MAGSGKETMRPTKNPYKRLRMLCSTTQVVFAKKHGLSKMAIVYVEAGVPGAVSDRLNEALAEECAEKGVDPTPILREEYHAADLDHAYWGWQRQERARMAGVFELIAVPFPHTPQKSPFQCLLETTFGNAEAFGKNMKVQPELVRRYADARTDAMPADLYIAFRDVEFKYLRELVEVQAAWAQEHR